MATFFNSKTGRGITLAIGLLIVMALGPVAVFALIVVIMLSCMIELGSFVHVPGKSLRYGAELAIAVQLGIVVAGGFAAARVVDGRGLWMTMVIIAAVFVENAAAQIFGKRFGRTRLAPRYSPNKTVEGALFGWVFGSLAGAVALALAWWLGAADDEITAHWKQWLAIIVIAPPVAEVGDWLESRMKRLVRVKDSADLTRASGSRLIRTLSLAAIFGRQGGALDKTDSLWFVMAASYIVLVTTWQIGLAFALSVVAAIVYVRMSRP